MRIVAVELTTPTMRGGSHQDKPKNRMKHDETEFRTDGTSCRAHGLPQTIPGAVRYPARVEPSLKESELLMFTLDKKLAESGQSVRCGAIVLPNTPSRLRICTAPVKFDYSVAGVKNRAVERPVAVAGHILRPDVQLAEMEAVRRP
jgi:hypothetical protein